MTAAGSDVRGELYEGVLPSVLRTLYVGRRTGVLTFSRDKQRCGVRVRQGNILSAETTVRGQRLGEMLVGEGRLSEADLKRAMGFMLRDGTRLGAVLLDLELLDATALEEAVARHAHGVLKHIFSWTEGSYQFCEEPLGKVLEGDVTLRLSTGELILQAAREVRDPDVVRYQIGDLDRVLSVSEDPLLRYQRISFAPIDGFILSRVDGRLKAREVIEITPLPVEDVHRSLFGLLSTGVLEYLGKGDKRGRSAEGLRAYADAPAAAPPQGAAGPEPATATPAEASAAGEAPGADETLALPAPASPAAPPLGTPSPGTSCPGTPCPVAPPPVAPPPPTGAWPKLKPPEEADRPDEDQEPAADPAAETIIMEAVKLGPADTQKLAPVDTRRLEILETHDALDQRTHFEVLGVPRDATEAQVREAYFRLSKRFHPDVHHDKALSDMRDKLERIFTALGEAYEVLSNPRIRASYERELARSEGASGPGLESRADAARAATDAIEAGRESLLQERYWEAIRLFEAAIPRAEGALKQEARVLLARAYAKNAGWVKQGEELLRSVLQEQPDNVEAWLQLGRIYKAQGLRNRAFSALRRALELQPSNREAAALVEELGSEGAPPHAESRKRLGKLFGPKGPS